MAGAEALVYLVKVLAALQLTKGATTCKAKPVQVVQMVLRLLLQVTPLVEVAEGVAGTAEALEELAQAVATRTLLVEEALFVLSGVLAAHSLQLM